MSLFERINNKIKNNLIIEMNNTGSDDPWDDKDTKTENKKKENKNKKINNKKEKIGSGTYNYSKEKKIKQEIGQRRTAQDRQQQLFSRQYDAYDDGDLGNPTQSKTQTTTKTTTQKTTSKNRAPRKGVDYFFDPEKAKADREKLISKRKEYGIDRKGNMSDAGAERYARKTKQLSSGSNIPVEITQADKDLARRRAVGGEKIRANVDKGGGFYSKKVIGTTTGKYGGRLGRTRNKNMPSYDEIKKQIDAKDKAIADRKIARKNKPQYIKTKVTDKEIQDIIKKGQQAIPKKGATVTSTKLANVDKAIKDLDDLIIEPKKGDVAKTKRLISKEVKRKTTPKPDEIKIQKNIIKQGPKATPFVTSDTKSLDDFIKAKDPFNVKGETPKGSSTGGGPNQNPEYQRLLNQQRRNNQAYDAFDDSDAGKPGTGNTIDNTTTRNRTTSKPETKPKSSKKFNGKSFDDFIKDAKKKNKAISQDIAKLKTKSFVPPTTTPSVTPNPITEPLKKTRTIKKIKIKAPPKTQTGTFKKIMKFAGKNKSPILKGLAYTAGGAYLLSRLGKTDNAPKNNKALGGVSGNYITKVKPVTATFTLAGKGGDGYRPAGMKK